MASHTARVPPQPPSVVQLVSGESASAARRARRKSRRRSQQYEEGDERKSDGSLSRLTNLVATAVATGEVEGGSVSVVVRALQETLAAAVPSARGGGEGACRALTPAAVEKCVKRIVAAVIPNPQHPVRKNLDSILWALKQGASLNKKIFGDVQFEFSKGSPTDVILAAMQQVQQYSNAQAGHVSGAMLQTKFGQMLGAKADVPGVVMREAQALVEAGLVEEMVSMLKDTDNGLSEQMVKQLKISAIEVGAQAAVAVAKKCGWGACCSASTSVAPARRHS